MIRGIKTPAQAIRKAMGPVLSNSFKSVSNPTSNIKMITPISAICVINSVWLIQPRTQGPTTRPARICPTTWGALHFLARIPNTLAKNRMTARSRNTLYVSILSPPS